MTSLDLGKYIGCGAFGQVYHAQWGGRRVAVKKFALSQDEAKHAAIQEEIRLLERLRDRRIIQFYGTTYLDNMLVIIMDLAEGGNLSRAIKNNELDWSNKTRIAQEIAHGLAYIHHEGVIHRDLKSPNVLLTKHMEVKLCDFGLAKAKTTSATNSNDTAIKGTFRWLAPEVFKPKPQYSTKSDIYALAITMWEMAANCTTPFQSHSDNVAIMTLVQTGVREKLPDNTPVEYRRWVERCWDHNPERRPEASEITLQKEELFSISNEGLESSVTISQIPGDTASQSSPCADSPITSQTQTHSITFTSTRPSTAQEFNTLLLKAQDGDVEAQVAIAAIYVRYRGIVEQNFDEAFRWYLKAANQGHCEAQHKVAVEYTKNRAVDKSIPTAVSWYRKAASQGHAQAQFNLADILIQGRGGVEANPAEAVVWYRKAAEQDHQGAQVQLGRALKEGQWTEQNDAEAVVWFRKAAEKKHRVGLYYLGTMYDTGRGVSQSDEEAFRLYSESVEIGYDEAQNKLGVWYRDGRYVQQSHADAIDWFRKADRQGNKDAQENLMAMKSMKD